MSDYRWESMRGDSLDDLPKQVIEAFWYHEMAPHFPRYWPSVAFVENVCADLKRRYEAGEFREDDPYTRLEEA